MVKKPEITVRELLAGEGTPEEQAAFRATFLSDAEFAMVRGMARKAMREIEPLEVERDDLSEKDKHRREAARDSAKERWTGQPTAEDRLDAVLKVMGRHPSPLSSLNAGQVAKLIRDEVNAVLMEGLKTDDDPEEALFKPLGVATLRRIVQGIRREYATFQKK